ncbi:MAG: hypothetical protein LBG17_08450 [Bacteroidales bacterium]|jgi:hypothetical protein|nr:hypothetical protein [Bacteroidales bacterium]
MKSSKRFMFTVVAVAITLLTSCKKESMKEQIIGTWDMVARQSKTIESTPINSKDIDWDWIYNLEQNTQNRPWIFTEETVNYYESKTPCPYSIDDEGKITILEDCWDWGNIGEIYYVKIKDEYLLWATINPNENDERCYFYGARFKRVSE